MEFLESGDEASEIDRNDSFHSVQTIKYYGEKNVLVRFCFLLNECSESEPTPKIFSTGEAILPRYIRLLTTTNSGNFYLKYYTK